MCPNCHHTMRLHHDGICLSVNSCLCGIAAVIEPKRCAKCNAPRDNNHESLCPACLLAREPLNRGWSKWNGYQHVWRSVV